MFIVFTEIRTENTTERWYYGTYTEEVACEVALELGNDRENGIFRNVCPLESAKEWGVLNLPL